MDKSGDIWTVGGLEGREHRSVCVPRHQGERDDQEGRFEDGDGRGSQTRKSGMIMVVGIILPVVYPVAQKWLLG